MQQYNYILTHILVGEQETLGAGDVVGALSTLLPTILPANSPSTVPCCVEGQNSQWSEYHIMAKIAGTSSLFHVSFHGYENAMIRKYIRE
jgi:hypothetical protein